jgi:hypothetical protein
LRNSLTSNDFIWWKIKGDKKPREMEFLSRQTFAFRENVSGVWTELQADKIGNDILETLPCAHSLNHYFSFDNSQILRKASRGTQW